jgi:hypothetical protein
MKYLSTEYFYKADNYLLVKQKGFHYEPLETANLSQYDKFQ